MYKKVFFLGLVTVYLLAFPIYMMVSIPVERYSLFPGVGYQLIALCIVIFTVSYFIFARRKKSGGSLKSLCAVETRRWKEHNYKFIGLFCLFAFIMPVFVIWPVAEYIFSLLLYFIEETPLLNLIPRYIPIDIWIWVFNIQIVYMALIYTILCYLMNRYFPIERDLANVAG